MKQEEAERLLEKKDGYRFTSMAYTDAEELADYALSCEADGVLLSGYNREARRPQCQWAADSAAALIGALGDFSGHISFIPKDWVPDMERAGFTVCCAWHDYFRNDLEQLPEAPEAGLLCPEEFAAASELTLACKNASRGFTGQTPDWFAEWLNSDDVRDAAILTERTADGALKGVLCTGTYAHDSERGPIVWVRELAVHPAYWRQGVGRRLLNAALAYGRAHGAKRAFLAADECNAGAIALYESAGFRPSASDSEIGMER